MSSSPDQRGRRRVGRPEVVFSEEMDRILRDGVGHMSKPELSTRLGVAIGTLKRRLAELGLPVHWDVPGGRPRTVLTLDQDRLLRALCSAGASLHAIQQSLPLARPTLRRLIDERGLPRLRRSRADRAPGTADSPPRSAGHGR